MTKKFMASFLAAGMAGSMLLSSCGGGTSTDTSNSGSTSGGSSIPSSTTSSGGNTAGTTPVTMTMWIHGGFIDNEGRWGKDETTKAITEKTGVQWEVSTNPAGTNADDKLNLMLASDDLPDTIIKDFNLLTKKMIDEGYVQDWESLAEQYGCKDLLDFIARNENTTFRYNRYADGKIYQPEGKIYAIPNWVLTEYSWEYALDWGNDFGDYMSGWLTRRDVYEGVGEPAWKTPEDALNTFRTVKENYKSINGEPLIPLGIAPMSGAAMNWRDLAVNWTGSKSFLCDMPDGSIGHFIRNPGFLEAMKWFNLLYREGLVETETFTMKTEQWNEKRANGSYFMLWGRDLNPNSITTLVRKGGNTDVEYRVLPAKSVFKGNNLDQIYMNITPSLGYTGWLGTYITKNCTNPEAAIKFMEYMWSDDGLKLQIYGPEGYKTTWNESKKRMEWMPGAAEEYAADNNKFIKETGIRHWQMWIDDGYAFKNGMWFDDQKAPIFGRDEARAEWKTPDIAGKENFNRENVTWLQSEASNVVENQVVQIMNAQMPKIFMAESEEECVNAYNDMIKQAEGVGLKELEADWNAALKVLEEVNGESYLRIPFDQKMELPIK